MNELSAQLVTNNEDVLWRQQSAECREALDFAGVDYTEIEGTDLWRGPQFTDATGRDFYNIEGVELFLKLSGSESRN